MKLVCGALAGLILIGASAPALRAQEALGQTKAKGQDKGPAKKKSGSVSGSPLDTLMNTHLHATVPPSADWVEATRPDPKTLDYTPLTGTDPDRPKPRDKPNVLALQAELERDGVLNEQKAHGLRPVPHRTRRAKRQDD